MKEKKNQQEKKDKQQEKKEKKKKSGFGFIWILLILLVLLLFLARGLGFGKGGGEGSEAGSSSEQSSSSVPDETEQSSSRKVRVYENSYFYSEGEDAGGESSLSLEELLSALEQGNSDQPVRITDDHASQKAYQELIDALKEKNIPYIEENAAESALDSEPDSTS